jgi:hypothetical protein
MLTGYVTRQHMQDMLALKQGEIDSLKERISQLLNKVNASDKPN